MKSWVLTLLTAASLQAQPCPFCDPEIIDSYSIAIEGEAFGLLTHKPVVPGHVLIIPVRHVERFDELTAAELVSLGAVVQEVHAASRRIIGNEDYLILQKNGDSAGRSVDHLHIHYLPRTKEEGHWRFALRFFLRPLFAPLSFEEMREKAALWREEIASLTHS